MNHTATVLFPLILFCGSSLAFSQNPASQAGMQPVIGTNTTHILGNQCPVDLQAQRRGIGSIVQTKGQPGEASQKLRLIWANRREKDIVAATIVGRGYDASPRIIPAGSKASPELAKTFNIRLNVSGNGRVTTDLLMQRFATVSWIDLKSVEYADGTSWNTSAEGSCRITPNGLLLVADAAEPGR